MMIVLQPTSLIFIINNESRLSILGQYHDEQS